METLIAFLLCFGIATAIDCPSMSNLVKVDIDFPRFVALVNVTKIEDWKSYKGDEYVTFHFHYRGFYKYWYSLESTKTNALPSLVMRKPMVDGCKVRNVVKENHLYVMGCAGYYNCWYMIPFATLSEREKKVLPKLMEV